MTTARDAIFIHNLRILRQCYQLTQKQLGQWLAKSNYNLIGLWESGRVQPKISEVIRVANGFEIPFNDLVNHPLEPFEAPKQPKELPTLASVQQSFSQNIRWLRQNYFDQPLSRLAFANEVNNFQVAVKEWESAKKIPLINILIGLANQFHVDLDTLVLGKVTMTQKEVEKQATVQQPLVNHLAENIQQLRVANGWSQQELGKVLGLKGARASVSGWETGRFLPKIANLLALCQVFGNELTLTQLVTSDDIETTPEDRLPEFEDFEPITNHLPANLERLPQNLLYRFEDRNHDMYLSDAFCLADNLGITLDQLATQLLDANFLETLKQASHDLSQADTANQMNFNKNLRWLRESRGMTQAALSEALNLSILSINKWEKGRFYPQLDNLLALANYLQVDLNTLVLLPYQQCRSIDPKMINPEGNLKNYLATNLKAIRETCGWTPYETTKRLANLPIEKWENSAGAPMLQSLLRLMTACHMDLNQLVTQDLRSRPDLIKEKIMKDSDSYGS